MHLQGTHQQSHLVICGSKTGPKRNEFLLVYRRPPDPEHVDVDEAVLQLVPAASCFEVVRLAVHLRKIIIAATGGIPCVGLVDSPRLRDDAILSHLTIRCRKSCEIPCHLDVQAHHGLGALDVLGVHNTAEFFVAEAALSLYQHSIILRKCWQVDVIVTETVTILQSMTDRFFLIVLRPAITKNDMS